jgi:cytochrome c oxidase cbb3-type subunit 3
LFKTIKYGVLAKGMPTWEKQLSPKQISDVANYIKSIHGTHPAGAKEPQGTKESDADNKLASNN